MSTFRIPKREEKKDPDSDRKDAAEFALEEVSFGGYVLERDETNTLRVRGCDCCAYISDVETAAKMIGVISRWIEGQA